MLPPNYWPGSGDRFVSQNPTDFVYLILPDGFWFFQISFGCMVEFQFLAQVPVNYFHDSVVSSLSLFLLPFVTFIYYMNYGFVSNTT